MTIFLTLTPHDPVIARDSRPFVFGTRMKSLDWPYPSVMAGSLRTLLGKKKDPDFKTEGMITELRNISVAGPFPLHNNELLFPAPRDLLVQKRGNYYEVYPIRPSKMQNGEGCDLPDKSLVPSQIPASVDDEFKADKTPPLWPGWKMVAWLLCPDGDEYSLFLPATNSGVFDLPEKDTRIHVSIDSISGTSQDGMLFQTTGLDLSLPNNQAGLQIAARVRNGEDYQGSIANLDECHPFGGERRLSHWKAVSGQAGWVCPDAVESAVSCSRNIRMVLASPGIFSGGWIPGWLTKQDSGSIEGTPPGAPEGVKLRLISACIDRWRPISGWDLEARSPKKIRRVVAAGSVYFFTVCEGSSASALASSCWLESVCDDEQDRRDGFGLALWGVWNEQSNMKEII